MSVQKTFVGCSKNHSTLWTSSPVQYGSDERPNLIQSLSQLSLPSWVLGHEVASVQTEAHLYFSDNVGALKFLWSFHLGKCTTHQNPATFMIACLGCNWNVEHENTNGFDPSMIVSPRMNDTSNISWDSGSLGCFNMSCLKGPEYLVLIMIAFSFGQGMSKSTHAAMKSCHQSEPPHTHTVEESTTEIQQDPDFFNCWALHWGAIPNSC